jgi:hypothetical protein
MSGRLTSQKGMMSAPSTETIDQSPWITLSRPQFLKEAFRDKRGWVFPDPAIVEDFSFSIRYSKVLKGWQEGAHFTLAKIIEPLGMTCP